ncbi:GAF domain-containing protein [Candidatus Puniceispirillum sp.]|nr:GAF domain-containing protein [Candidatus Puniceispirillum sp.]
MSLQTIPRPSSGDFATRPENEERRVQAVVKTGLIDAPNSDLFQIYCDLAKDLTGYEQAKFSLFDGEAQCSMGAAGVDESYEVGARTERSKWNVCSYVLLDTEPMIVEDFYLDPDWIKHPFIESGDAPHSYAGFPVVNRDNYALGTLCLFNTDVKKLSVEQVELIKRITKNIAHLLDLQVEQRSLTAEKIVRASDALSKEVDAATLTDFKALLLLESDMSVDQPDATNLLKNKFCEIDLKSNVVLTADGRRLIEKMGLTPKPMKRVKITGNDASELVDKMFSELE